MAPKGGSTATSGGTAPAVVAYGGGALTAAQTLRLLRAATLTAVCTLAVCVRCVRHPANVPAPPHPTSIRSTPPHPSAERPHGGLTACATRAGCSPWRNTRLCSRTRTCTSTCARRSAWWSKEGSPAGSTRRAGFRTAACWMTRCVCAANQTLPECHTESLLPPTHPQRRSSRSPSHRNGQRCTRALRVRTGVVMSPIPLAPWVYCLRGFLHALTAQTLCAKETALCCVSREAQYHTTRRRFVTTHRLPRSVLRHGGGGVALDH
jgi:hypothetical protein